MSEIIEQARAFIDAAYGATDAKGLAHSREVGDLLAALGCDEDVVATGLLHDVVEDTGTDVETLRQKFGDQIADLVYALSEDEAIADYAERKRALREGVAIAGPTALTISAADKVSRLRAADRAGKVVPERKLLHYQQTADLLVAQGITSPHVAEIQRRLRNRRLQRPAEAAAAPAAPAAG
ncbi:MAG TPA: HD domain-containing protein [Baekduia sp.]